EVQDALGQRLEEGAEPFLALPKLRLGPLESGDVLFLRDQIVLGRPAARDFLVQQVLTSHRGSGRRRQHQGEHGRQGGNDRDLAPPRLQDRCPIEPDHEISRESSEPRVGVDSLPPVSCGPRDVSPATVTSYAREKRGRRRYL